MNIVFVTLMYGVGLPLLFPIALLSFFILYCNERILLAYWYKQPPSLDERMNNSAIKIMRWAAFIGCGFGYYMSSNKQMFYNDVTPVLVGNEPTITNHEFLTSITVD